MEEKSLNKLKDTVYDDETLSYVEGLFCKVKSKTYILKNNIKLTIPQIAQLVVNDFIKHKKNIQIDEQINKTMLEQTESQITEFLMMRELINDIETGELLLNKHKNDKLIEETILNRLQILNKVKQYMEQTFSKLDNNDIINELFNNEENNKTITNNINTDNMENIQKENNIGKEIKVNNIGSKRVGGRRRGRGRHRGIKKK